MAAVKYLHQNAETFGVNKDQIMLNGSFWGATMALGAAILLGRENKQNLVKALFLQMGWLNDCLKSVEPNTVLDWERWLLKGDTEKYFKLFANDFPN